MSNSFTAIVDYGVGNLKSVTNAMTYLGMKTCITSDAKELERADAIILPGVGAFPDAMERLRAPGLDRVLAVQAEKKPILGICLGMQLLFDEGEEVRACKGLGLVHGRVKRLETGSPLFRGLEDGKYVYFVHSYCGVAADEGDVIARTEYGPSVVAAVSHGTVFGCQFHPEKSGETGLQILKNFGELNQ